MLTSNLTYCKWDDSPENNCSCCVVTLSKIPSSLVKLWLLWCVVSAARTSEISRSGVTRSSVHTLSPILCPGDVSSNMSIPAI